MEDSAKITKGYADRTYNKKIDIQYRTYSTTITCDGTEAKRFAINGTKSGNYFPISVFLYYNYVAEVVGGVEDEPVTTTGNVGVSGYFISRTEATVTFTIRIKVAWLKID